MLCKGHTSDYDIADIKRERSTSDYAVSEIRWEMSFSLRFCTRKRSKTYMWVVWGTSASIGELRKVEKF